MCELVKILKNKNGFIGGKGASELSIKEAEDKLNIKFSYEYKEYLRELGMVCFDGVELTGIGLVERMDVVNNTLEQRNNNLYTTSMYVLEILGIDDIVIWQETNGAVYQTVGNNKPKKIYNTFKEYILDL